MHDWLRAFPRNQLYVIKLEEFSLKCKTILAELYDFLDIGKNIFHVEHHSFTTFSDGKLWIVIAIKVFVLTTLLMSSAQTKTKWIFYQMVVKGYDETAHNAEYDGILSAFM